MVLYRILKRHAFLVYFIFFVSPFADELQVSVLLVLHTNKWRRLLRASSLFVCGHGLTFDFFMNLLAVQEAVPVPVPVPVPVAALSQASKADISNANLLRNPSKVIVLRVSAPVDA